MEDSIEELAEKIKVCQLCRLHKSRSQAVPGEGCYRARIMFTGEAPGSEEDRLGRPSIMVIDSSLYIWSRFFAIKEK